jgi:hypothetical protein
MGDPDNSDHVEKLTINLLPDGGKGEISKSLSLKEERNRSEVFQIP